MKQADKSFLESIEAHQGILWKVAHAYCPDKEHREDLIQEITLQLWKSWEKFDGRVKLSTWMYRVALNVAISFFRKESKRNKTLIGSNELPEGPDLATSHPLETSDDVKLLNDIIQGLSDFNKALILLYMEDFSHKDIAESLGISVSNVGTKLNRLKKQMKDQMNERTSHGH